jgi:hypothetical protein
MRVYQFRHLGSLQIVKLRKPETVCNSLLGSTDHSNSPSALDESLQPTRES